MSIDALSPLDGRYGGISAINPRTGAIEAAAGIAFTAVQPPGSTFKIVTAIAALRLDPVQIVKLHGSVELSPLVGLADLIVDLVATGSTLREHDMVIVDEIAPSTARLRVQVIFRLRRWNCSGGGSADIEARGWRIAGPSAASPREIATAAGPLRTAGSRRRRPR